MNVPFWKILMPVMLCMIAAQVRAIDRKTAVHFEVYNDHLLIRTDSGSFAAPHFSKAGDTFQSLSQEFYGETDSVGVLAQVAGLSMDSAIPPGTTVYMIASYFIIPFGADSQEILLNEALDCAERMNNQPLSALWDVSLPISQTGGKFRQPTTSRLTLQTVDGSRLKLEILFPPDTIMTDVLKGNVATTTLSCSNYD